MSDIDLDVVSAILDAVIALLASGVLVLALVAAFLSWKAGQK